MFSLSIYYWRMLTCDLNRFCCRRRRYTRVHRGEVVDGGFQSVGGGVPNKKMPVVLVAEK